MVLVFGATGFSGRMVVDQLVARGLPVRAAARSAEKLEALAGDLSGVETVVADVADPQSVARATAGCALLITTVGPYTKFGDVAAEAALAAGIPYIDITGEPAWLRRVFGEYGARAAGLGIAMIPAFGYDYVPGNLAGAIALERFGERAVRIDVAYFLAGDNERNTESFSKGTLDSLEASSRERGFAFVGGALTDVDGPRRKFEYLVDGAPVSAVAIGGSEHFTLPRLAPWLTDVNVALGWFTPGQQRADDAPGSEGPSERKRAEARARIVAVARDASGEALGEIRADGPNPYDMSGLLSAWAAERILAGELRGSGALGPVDAFGLDELRAGCAEIGLTAG
ncbi:MAG: NAD(P)H-binding protein [Solirubrobacterales bacterium]